MPDHPRRPMNAATATFAILAALLVPAFGEKPPADNPAAADFIRVDEDANAARLQTAVTRYAKNGATVDLIGAIHIADKKYYDALEKRFDAYDAVLFEMIGGENPRGRKEPAEKAEKAEKAGEVPENEDKGENLDVLHQIYGMVSRFLKLTDQMSRIDYTRKNFVHADLSMKEFHDLQAKRGESLLGFALDAAANAGEDGKLPKQPDMTRLFQALITGNSNMLKLEIVHTLGAGDDQISAFAGESVIISDRNAKCLKVLDEQIAVGKRKIGVFYGAAHFPDMEKRLLAAGWKRKDQKWMTAWDIPKPKQADPAG